MVAELFITMSEEEKTEQQPATDNNQPEQKIPGETIVPAVEEQPQSSNLQPQTEQMEVHKHPHHVTHKKKWGEYLLEFLMLFLAVFLGFLAENIREHTVEKEREKQFIMSLISDLKDDTLIITRQINYIERGLILFDSLSLMLESPESAKKNEEAIYYTSRMGIRLAPLANNTRTIDQLKNSGGFRLIRKQEVSSRIMKYYSVFPELRMIEEFFDKENLTFKEVASRIMDQSVYRKQIRPDGSIERITGNLSLLTYDPAMLNQLGFYAVQMNGSRKGMKQLLYSLRQSAGELLGYLQKEYHLD